MTGKIIGKIFVKIIGKIIGKKVAGKMTGKMTTKMTTKMTRKVVGKKVVGKRPEITMIQLGSEHLSTRKLQLPVLWILVILRLVNKHFMLPILKS
jgi:hypothetical protein